MRVPGNGGLGVGKGLGGPGCSTPWLLSSGWLTVVAWDADAEPSDVILVELWWGGLELLLLGLVWWLLCGAMVLLGS